MTIRETRIFNSKIRKLERLSEQYLNSKIKIEIENKKLKQKLKNTRKALEIARNGLIDIFGYEGVPKYVVKHIIQVLDQIKNETAPEQRM